ncbi:mitochondrial carrier protein [Rozella allomycis CSF55]|uniref:Mitochondrial carrier protein n=1 Tax=Rozella allomycis (strain CSF55) TaxID=988480 RepID=A0A4P9YBZ6_ROZAC|nr:mitochondrial carrier protein [Rozella allomycis CSF55]
MNEENSATRYLKDFSAGWFGGIVQVLVGQPFDTVKVRMQSNPDLYPSTMSCIKNTFKNEGALAFYKGSSTPLIGIGACVSIQFGALEAMKRVFGGKDLTLSQMYVAGGISGLANSIASTPVEHIRIRLQVQAKNSELYRGSIDAIQKIYKSHGFNGLYKGHCITMIREFFGYGIYFAAYEKIINRFIKFYNVNSRTDLSSWQVILAGGTSGVILWTFLYPVDLIKSCIQTDGFGKNAKYSSSLNCFSTIVKQGGYSALYRGFVPCILRAFPVNAMTFMAFEFAMNIMGRL